MNGDIQCDGEEHMWIHPGERHVYNYNEVQSFQVVQHCRAWIWLSPAFISSCTLLTCFSSRSSASTVMMSRLSPQCTYWGKRASPARCLGRHYTGALKMAMCSPSTVDSARRQKQVSHACPRLRWSCSSMASIKAAQHESSCCSWSQHAWAPSSGSSDTFDNTRGVIGFFFGCTTSGIFKCQSPTFGVGLMGNGRGC